MGSEGYRDISIGIDIGWMSIRWVLVYCGSTGSIRIIKTGCVIRFSADKALQLQDYLATPFTIPICRVSTSYQNIRYKYEKPSSQAMMI
jgi:hypothetical protein